MLVDRVAVLGSGQELAEETRRKGITEVLIAIPSARGAQMAQILQHCHAAAVPCKTDARIGRIRSKRSRRRTDPGRRRGGSPWPKSGAS